LTLGLPEACHFAGALGLLVPLPPEGGEVGSGTGLLDAGDMPRFAPRLSAELWGGSRNGHRAVQAAP
jgi:hypothetical protein